MEHTSEKCLQEVVSMEPKDMYTHKNKPEQETVKFWDLGLRMPRPWRGRAGMSNFGQVAKDKLFWCTDMMFRWFIMHRGGSRRWREADWSWPRQKMLCWSWVGGGGVGGGSLSWQLEHADDAPLIDHAHGLPHGRECFVDRGLVGVGVGLIRFLFFLLTGACR